MESARDAARRKRQLARLEQEAQRARCAHCGKKVTTEDRCQDGLYLHYECAYQTSRRFLGS